MRMNNHFAFLLLFLFMGVEINAQVHSRCGTRVMPEEMQISNLDLNRAIKAYQKNKAVIYKNQQDVDTISINLHVIRNSNGSEITSLQDIRADVALTNDKFSGARMYFEVCDDIHYINDSSSQPFGDDDDARLIKTSDMDPNSVDIYYIGDFVEENLGGYFTRNQRGYYIVMGNPGGTTLAHEIGHYYGLAHTHGMYNADPSEYLQNPSNNTGGFPIQVYYEGAVRFHNNQNDTNGNQLFDCMETGDGVCDTPAEPVYLGWPESYNYSTCIYTPGPRDYYNDLYDPDVGNIMSYGFCFDFDEFFTQGQLDRMRVNLNRNRLSELCGACNAVSGERIVTNSSTGGKGSFNWALDCQKGANATIRIKFQIDPEDDLLIDIGKSFLSLDAEKIIIDGKDLNSGNNIILEGTNFSLEADSIVLKNLIIKDATQFNSALSLRGRNTSVLLENITILNGNNGIYAESIQSFQLKDSYIGVDANSNAGPNDRSGVYLSDVRRVSVLNNVIANNETTGLFLGQGVEEFDVSGNEIYNNLTGILLRESEDGQVTNNIVHSNLGIGAFIAEVENLEFHGNIFGIDGEEEAGNADLGAYISDVVNLAIGTDDPLMANTFAYSADGLAIAGNTNVDFGINSIYCNERTELSNITNIRVSRPVITSTSGVIRGESDPLVDVFLFGQASNCNNCGVEAYLGNSTANSEGEWEINIDYSELEFGDRISAYASDGSGFSNISECTLAEVPVGCNDKVDQFPYVDFLEAEELVNYRVLGSDVELVNKSSCEDQDEQILMFEARNPSSQFSILYTRTFDLTDAAFAVLEFDLAHGRTFSTNESILVIEVSSDCGESYNSIFSQSSFDGLITNETWNSIDAYTPQGCEDWRGMSIDISSFVGSEVLFKFQVSYERSFGQNLFIDNLLVDKGEPCPTVNSTENSLFVQIEESSIELCEGEETSLTADHSGLNLVWTVDGQIVDDFDPSSPLTLGGRYVANVSNRFGCALSDTAEVIVYDVPEFELGEDITACEGDEESLLLVNNSGSELVRWFVNDENRSEATGQAQFLATESGVYISVASGEGACLYRDTINIVINELPTFEPIAAMNACEGDPVEINLISNATEVIWTLDGEEVSVDDPYSFSTELEGTLIAEMFNDFGCSVTTEVSIERPPVIEVALQSMMQICPGDINIYSVTPVDGASIVWYQEDQIIATDVSEIEVGETGMYTVEYTDALGCTYSSSSSLIVESAPVVSLLTESTEYCEGEVGALEIESDNGEILQWLIGGQVISGEENGEIEISESGVYTAIVVNEFGCLSSVDQRIEFYENPEVDLGEDRLFCIGNEGQIGIEDLGFNYKWTLDGNDLSEDGSFITPTENGSYSLEVSNDFGCMTLDRIDVEVVAGPQLVLEDSFTICPEDAVTIDVQSDAQSFSWFYEGEFLGVRETGTIILDQAGTYELKAIGSTGCEATAQVEISYFESPEISVEPAYYFCEGADVTVDMLNPTYSYEWYRGTEILMGDGSESSFSSPGMYAVVASNENGCIHKEIFQVYEIENPTVELSESYDLCIGEEIQITAITDGMQGFWALDDIQFSETSNEITISSPGELKFTSVNEFSCSTTLTADIIERELPEVTLSDSYVLCPSEELTLDAGEHISYSWSNGENTPQITLRSEGVDEEINETISVMVSNEYDCSSTFETVVKYKSVLDANILAERDSICSGDEITLFVIGGEEQIWLESGIMGAELTISPEETTSYSVEVSDQCPGNIQTLEIEISVSDGSEVYVTPDTCITKGDQIQLDVKGASYVEWTPHNSFVSDMNVFNPIVSPEEDQTYDVYVEDLFGCMYDYQIEVCVGDIYDIFNPANVLTPSTQDQMNDALTFNGLSNYPGARLTVMNRWGMKVFTHLNYQSDERLFDGHNDKGSELDPGNYYYILEVPGFTEVIKSSLTIIR